MAIAGVDHRPPEPISGYPQKSSIVFSRSFTRSCRSRSCRWSSSSWRKASLTRRPSCSSSPRQSPTPVIKVLTSVKNYWSYLLLTFLTNNLGSIAQWIAFSLFTQWPSVWFTTFLNFFPRRNCRCCWGYLTALLLSGVDSRGLITLIKPISTLASGKLVLQKNTF